MTWAKHVPDADLVDAVADAAEDGATDPLDGGVHPSTLADRVDISTGRLHARLSRLADAGELRRVEGINPETLQARTSFLPADD